MTSFIKGDGGILEIKSGNDIIWTNRENRGYKPSNEEAKAALEAFLHPK